jgi:hypothetical protein
VSENQIAELNHKAEKVAVLKCITQAGILLLRPWAPKRQSREPLRCSRTLITNKLTPAGNILPRTLREREVPELFTKFEVQSAAFN